MVRLKAVGILSYGYLVAVVSAIVAFLYSLMLYPILRGLVDVISSGEMNMDYGALSILQGFAGAGFIFMIIVFPIVAAISGFIGGCLGAIVYNLGAKITGGIEFNFVKVPKIDYSGKSSISVEEEDLPSHSAPPAKKDSL